MQNLYSGTFPYEINLWNAPRAHPHYDLAEHENCAGVCCSIGFCFQRAQLTEYGYLSKRVRGSWFGCISQLTMTHWCGPCWFMSLLSALKATGTKFMLESTRSPYMGLVKKIYRNLPGYFVREFRKIVQKMIAVFEILKGQLLQEGPSIFFSNAIILRCSIMLVIPYTCGRMHAQTHTQNRGCKPLLP